MKNICALLVVVQLAAASQLAGAQQAGPDGPLTSDLPPALEQPADDPGALDRSASPNEGAADSLTPIPEPIAAGEGEFDEFDGSILGEPMKMLAGCTPLFESSGTWLRRGFWFGEVDYWMMNRSWDKKGVTLAREEAVRSNNPTGLTPFVVANVLNLEGHSPGAEGMGRVKLGRFLFRDSRNRDHLLEASWWGGGSFEQAVSLESATASAAANTGLQVSNFIDRVNPSFDGASAMDFFYRNQTNSAEVNYEVRQRMDRDQLVLQPSGQWVRTASPTRTLSFLTGIRYVNLRELLDWNSTDNVATTATDEGGFYNVMTENNLLGTQIGGSLSQETARWSVTASAKAGAYWNRIDLNSSFQVGETTVRTSGRTNSEEDDLAFVGEAEILGKWHLRPNVSLRAGFGLLFIDSVALAPHQVNFVPGGYTAIANAGDSVFLGGSLGLESYW
ncbi:MAG: BBP7 family outer membrane beta-barrel protein [Pirellulales bacterium]|nr:BBP7 family outer membrane beta-barrel protein [Pirellulales bacterium]